MKKIPLILVALVFSIISLSQEDYLSPKEKRMSDCRENAAYKIIDEYSRRIADYHNIIDIDVIDFPLKNELQSSLLSVQWLAKTDYEYEIFWISGILKMDDYCCNTEFDVQEYSKNLYEKPLLEIGANLDCTNKFIPKSMGTGKPFKRLQRNNDN